MKKIAFIGTGNMASAICGGILNANITSCENIILYDKNVEQYSKFPSFCKKASSLSEAVSIADCIFFSVKPQNIKEILIELKDLEIQNKLFVSICAGITISSIENILKDIKIIRTMPNTPLLIGQGVTALCKNKKVTLEEFEYVKSIFSSSGYTTEVDEEEINRITAITSSSPAYVYLFAKAMLDGAKEMGIDKSNTLEMICRTIIGAANMMLLDSRSPDELIKMVKSPNGTTEKALNVFENMNFTNIIAEAMKACSNRADELSKID